MVPWGITREHSLIRRTLDGERFAAGFVSNPITDFTFDVRCSATACSVDPTSLGENFRRTVPSPEYAPGLAASSSAFAAKIRAHEQDHVDDYANPARCGYRYWNRTSLLLFMAQCATDSGPNGCLVPIVDGNRQAAEAEARVRLEIASVRWQKEEADANRRDGAFDRSEIEAWDAVDDMEPHYIYEKCNTEYANKPKPACVRPPEPE
jgi:hypothetical protein